MTLKLNGCTTMMITCPHCFREFNPSKKLKVAGGETKFREDVKRAQASIGVLERQPYPELREAAMLERTRLLLAIAQPEKLYAIYRRSDKKLAWAYGMVERAGAA